jgi:type IV pilus assembly protein PilN
MRVPINLASQPYDNLRPIYAAAVIGVLLLVILSATVVWKAEQNRSDTRMVAEQSEQLVRDSSKLHREEQELTLWLARPEVQEIRDHSAFLNGLITRKSLSWTQMFMDLEKILPDNVQVNAIRPSPNQTSEAQLNFTVSSPAVAPLVEFLKRLESAPQFAKPVVESQRFPADKSPDPNIILELTVAYHQDQSAVVPKSDEQASEGRDRAVTPDSGTVAQIPGKEAR